MIVRLGSYLCKKFFSYIEMPCVQCMTEVEEYFSSTPRADLLMVEPPYIPLPGQTIIGYNIYERPKGCFTRPRPSKLSILGWITVFCTALIFWPAACIPCCISAFYEGYQVPIYN